MTGESRVSPPQAEVLARGLLNSGFSCVLQMPTGSGKTWLAEQAISSILASGRRAVYLSPLRALAVELSARWQRRFESSKVGVFTGDFGKAGTAYPVSFRDAQLLVMTPERLDACTRAWRAHWSWLPEVDLLIVDEFHLLGDHHRGGRLEGAISRLRRLNPFALVLGLSATLGNRRELADWLGGVEYGSEWRPVPIKWRVARYRQANEKPGILTTEVQRNVSAGGRSLVFVQSRRRAEELSRQLRTSGLRAGHHHAGLSRPERNAIEGGFRSGEMDVLVSTSTLEMGLNLPVRQVVLYDIQAFDGVDFRPLSTNSVWQRVGRAGRPGLDSEGEAVLLAPTWDREAARYSEGRFEPIRSGFADSRVLAEQVVAEVASGLSRTPLQLESVFAQSLAAHQKTLPEVGSVIEEMREAGMLRERTEHEGQGGKMHLRATRLGRVASRHLLTPATIIRFRRMLESEEELTFLDLLLLAASSPDCDPVLPVDFEELDALASDLAQERTYSLRQQRDDIAEQLGVDGKRLLSALKMALVARAWTRSCDVREVAERYGCYPFEVTRLCESLQRLLLAMSAVLEDPEDKSEHDGDDKAFVELRERLHALYRMMVGGLDEAAATLTLVVGIGPKTARRLVEADVEDIEDLALTEPADLAAVPGVSLERAKRWVIEAEDLVRTRSAFRYRETGPVAGLRPLGWPARVDPYRLRRALDLSVVADGDGYLVAGGLEPHVVHGEPGDLVCDCKDAERGYGCKHGLAVRLHQGDEILWRFVRQLDADSADDKLNLFDLWFSGGYGARRKVVS